MAASELLPRTRNGRPKLRCTDDVLYYWAERIDLVAPEREHFSYSSMICEGDRLYHYGHHFELARIIRDKRGRTRLVLLNGDSYAGSGGFGPSTASRQADARNAVARTGAPNVVVPFSALEGAGIDLRSIMPIHVREDRWTVEEHSSRKRPAKLAKMRDPSGATEMETYYGYDEHRQWVQLTREVPALVQDPNATVHFSTEHGFCDNGAQLDADGVWHWHVRRHWLGDAVFRARYTERRTRKATAEELAVHDREREWTAESNRLHAAIRALDDRPRSFETHRAYVIRRQRESRAPNYGQMFRRAFAMAGFQAKLNEHCQIQPDSSPVREGRVPITVTRWATFLSSFDYQEPAPLYFLCELPYRAKPNTVDEAVEALKPPEVVAALARGLNVIRQGDLFAIPTKLTKRQIRRMARGRSFEKRLRVLGTNHSVAEGIVLKGGAVLGRGVMRHEPEGWRPPDHQRVQLGTDWHLLVRNTVPRTR